MRESLIASCSTDAYKSKFEEIERLDSVAGKHRSKRLEGAVLIAKSVCNSICPIKESCEEYFVPLVTSSTSMVVAGRTHKEILRSKNY